MISKNVLDQIAVKKQTIFLNVYREYLQNLYLASFYQKKGSQNFLFKGGTSLRLVYDSPRYSEDLDFSGIKNSVQFEDVLTEVMLDLTAEGLKINLAESKLTTGGHLAILKIKLFGQEFELYQEISFRKLQLVDKELVLVDSDFMPVYQIYLLDPKIVVAEKIQALLTRQKPRDYFDLYFILRKEVLRKNIKIDNNQRETILANLKKQDKVRINRELKSLLPKSFWKIIKDLPESLKRELER